MLFLLLQYSVKADELTSPNEHIKSIRIYLTECRRSILNNVICFILEIVTLGIILLLSRFLKLTRDEIAIPTSRDHRHYRKHFYFKVWVKHKKNFFFRKKNYSTRKKCLGTAYKELHYYMTKIKTKYIVNDHLVLSFNFQVWSQFLSNLNLFFESFYLNNK